MNKYSSFGLNIWSEFILNELTPQKSATPDVMIYKGQVSFDFSKGLKLFEDVYFIKAKSSFLLYVEGVAIYEVRDGNKIAIEILNRSILEEYKIFLYSTCFNIILLQRDIMCIHGAGILKNGKINLFVGYSGKGKSTLTTFFIQNGYSFIGDDVLPLKIRDDNQVYAGSSVGIVKLWENNINSLGLGKENGSQIRLDVQKFRYTFHNSLAEGYFPISKIFILNWSNDDTTFEIQKLSTIEAVFYLREHVFRPQFINEPEEYSLMLNLIALVAQQTETFSINGKRNLENLNMIKSIL